MLLNTGRNFPRVGWHHCLFHCMIANAVFSLSQCLSWSTCGQESFVSRYHGRHISISLLQWSHYKFQLLGHASLKRYRSEWECSCSIQRVICRTSSSSSAWWFVLWVFDRAKESLMFPLTCLTSFRVPAICQCVFRAGAVTTPVSFCKYMISLLTVQRHDFVTFV